MSDEASIRLDRRHDALFRQLGLVNGGVAYIYDIAIRTPPRDRTCRPFCTNCLAIRRVIPRLPATMRSSGCAIPTTGRLSPPITAPCSKLPDIAFRTCVCRMKHLDGSWRWIEARERVFSRDRSGRVRRVLGFVCDITERRRLLESLAGATDALLLAEENERRRIGRELHDSTTQHLVAIDLTMSRLEQRIGDDPTDRAIVRDIRAALTAAHREIRTFSYLLHPPSLERVGLEAALNRFLRASSGARALR